MKIRSTDLSGDWCYGLNLLFKSDFTFSHLFLNQKCESASFMLASTLKRQKLLFFLQPVVLRSNENCVKPAALVNKEGFGDRSSLCLEIIKSLNALSSSTLITLIILFIQILEYICPTAAAAAPVSQKSPHLTRTHTNRG